MKKLVAVVAGLGITFTSWAQGVHEHGAARLQVAIDGTQLVIELQSPLDNLVGFEHRPVSDAQRRALAEAQATLRDFDALFVLPAVAGCAVAGIELVLPANAGKDHAHDHRAERGEGHAHDDHADDGVHGELHARYQLSCTRPQVLTGIVVRLTEVFPRTARIRAETATPSGQGAVTLTRGNNRLPL